jgi:hypothetical protein
MVSPEPDEGLAYWRARVDELESALKETTGRLAALASLLPAEFVFLLLLDAEALRKSCSGRAVSGLEDGVNLRPGRAALELPALWKRVGGNGSDGA